MDERRHAQWRKVQRICAHLRQAARLLDDVCERSDETRNMSAVLRSFADGLDELKPAVEPGEPDSCIVLSMETGERLS